MADPMTTLVTDTPTIAYFVAGALGTFVRSAASTTQGTRTWRTLMDVLIGGCGGALLPTLGTLVIPDAGQDLVKNLTVFQKAIFIALLALAGSYFGRVIEMRHNGLPGVPPPEPPK